MQISSKGTGRPRVARIAILGGGMGGLSCAHELSLRGLDVTVYEASQHLGGKARSHYVSGTGTNGRRDLPGEHGFRFYPAFYRHVIQTMNEIPDRLSPTGTVAGNLVGTPEAGIVDRGEVMMTPRRPRNVRDAYRSIYGVYRMGGTMRDMGRYLSTHLKFVTSCEGRREEEVEPQAWARYTGLAEPGRYGEAFREVMLSCTSTMVAMHAERGSSRTLGHVSSLLMMDWFGSAEVDRTMMGPTSQCWLEPWQDELERRGTRFVFGAPTTRVQMEGGVVNRAWVRGPDGDERPIEADAFVLAAPLEVAHRLVTPEMAAADSSLARLARLDMDRMTNWMTGAQFFLREDIPVCAGHVFFPRAPWGLTLISQAQFWNRGRRGMATFGDGTLRGILSVDVSNCFAPDRHGKRLVDYTSRQAILDSIFDQLLRELDAPTQRLLKQSVFASHLDDELHVGPTGVTNMARLLVHPPGSWKQRPNATLSIPNLFLAADYVRTNVDVASMEGANEAGRLAARGVLDLVGHDPMSVKLFEYEALDRFRPLQRVDRALYAAGLPHWLDAGDALREKGRQLLLAARASA
jgi:uncharacterized protein with NAD-binding domain and iron-sulfur cluster